MSSKNQVVVPAIVRRALRLRAGDRLIWRVTRIKNQSRAIAAPAPKDWAKLTRGLGKEIWNGVDIDAYISEIRSEWESQK